jgi:hypothetical protein
VKSPLPGSRTKCSFHIAYNYPFLLLLLFTLQALNEVKSDTLYNVLPLATSLSHYPMAIMVTIGRQPRGIRPY